MLREFPGYTLATLLAEDATLLRLMAIEGMGRREPEEVGDDW